MTTPLLTAALLLLLLPGTRTQTTEAVPIDVVVENTLLQTKPETFSTRVAYRGILLGALKGLMASDAGFSFTFTEDPTYGPYLQSVNGVPGNAADRTYWELLVETPDGKTIRPNVGIGCYIPSARERIILRLTKW